MQDELLKFKLLKVWTLVDLPRDKWAIGTKWVFRNKKDERGIVVKNKARLVAQGYTQEEVEDSKALQMELTKALIRYEEGEEVDVHLYRSMIGSLMYLTASRPDITFAVCACARFQVTPKTSHLHVVKRIFKYLKEYVAAANCCRHVLWIQNQMLDYGFNFMNTKIYIDNESTICIVKNPVFHSKTKHIEIRHHFIRDSYEKKLIQVIKIHTDQNVADLLTKAFDVGDEAVHKELGDRMERAATTASSLEATQDSDAQTWFETASIKSNDPPLSRVKTLRSGEDSMKLIELMKSEGSEGFHQIIDFLTTSHIKYALTESPIIYVSLIHQFWETASASTSENGEMEITATIDGRVTTIIEASIRRHLKLEDSDGINTLPTTDL
ncbi:ribonuclease H-like domain-containing protein [Tanacetum coccineum]